ncbi:MAG: peptidase [Halothiobacillus sp. 14-55-98]|jgi:Zn-dependent membrane protease YugP|nr:MAG: peptidase [Halothiobacillus sp. 14-55-98]
MSILLLAAMGLLALLSWWPNWWVGQVMARHAQPADRYPFSGGDLARYLLDRRGLSDVTVEATKEGDHYDPHARSVRLSPANFSGRSLTAITVAAHEVGHALQHAEGDPAFARRQEMVERSAWAQRVAGWILVAIPAVTLIEKQPAPALVMLVVGVLTMAVPLVAQLSNLPIELDASFKRALPMLEEGGWLGKAEKKPARQILRAAAFTYVAQALSSVLNVVKWLRGLRM